MTTPTATCAECGADFETPRAARYCSTACRSANTNRKRAAAVDIVTRQSAVVRRGIAAGDLESVRDELDALAAEAERVLA